MRNPLDLSGRSILVTGAASGIGRAVAVLLADLGAHLVLVDRDVTGLDATLSQLNGPDHVLQTFDLRDTIAIPDAVTRWAAESGLFSGLVHAAGISCISPMRLLSPDLYRDVMAVNVEAALALARGFQRPKAFGGTSGSIVFIASVMGIVGSVGAVGYSLSKGALIAMARSMAVELAPRRIRVNCVAPGFVRTPMLDRLGAKWDAQQASLIEAQHPLGLGEAEDVANACAFLLAASARWITGTVLTVDGGYTAH